MGDFVVLGTDTDAGKTTFAAMWLTAFPEYAYWKPLETGESDTETIRRRCPGVTVFPPLMHFAEAVAPSLAARREGRVIPTAEVIAASRPASDRPLLIETFGGPFSPLNDDELQIELIRKLSRPCVLVVRSTVGAVGRAVSAVTALRSVGVSPVAVVLMGPRDEFAEVEIRKYSGVVVVSSETSDALRVVRDSISQSLTRRAGGVSPLSSFQPPRQGADAPRSPCLSLVERDRAAVWHPYTSLRDPIDPLPVVSAKDEFLVLEDGRIIIDAVSSWWTILHGHRPAWLVDELHAAAERLDHVIFGGATHPHAVEVAELLLATVPWRKGGRVFFSDNGSTAVEVALKMAYQWWVHRGESQRTLFVGFENGYHGDTFGAMAVGRDPLFFGTFEPLLFKAVQIPVSAVALDETLTRDGSRIAAVIIEPLVQGAGGMRMHSPETLAELYAVARKHGVLFIADEVMTGGRTGDWWAHAQAKIQPDLICSAKTLAGGMLPLAATLASPDIVDAFDTDDRAKTLFHGHSFTANPLACAVAARNLAVLANGHWLEDVRRIGNFWADSVSTFRDLRGVVDVRRSGTIFAVEVESPGGYLAEVGPRVKTFSAAQGVLLRPLGNVVYAMPPLCTSGDSLHKIRDVMVKAIRGLHEVL